MNVKPWIRCAVFGIFILPMGALMLQAQPLYWTDRTGQTVTRAELDGSNPQVILNASDGIGLARVLAYDSTNNKVYLNDTSTVKRFNPDGSGIETLVTGLGFGAGVAVAPSLGFVYYSDLNTGIFRIPINGGAATQLVSGVNFVDFSIDVANNKLYYPAFSGGDIRQADLDTGANISNLVTGLSAAWAADVVPSTSHVYYTDKSSSTGALGRINTNGTGNTTLISDNNEPEGIFVDLDNSFLFYTLDVPNQVVRANLDGTGSTVLATVAGDTHSVLVIPEPSTYGLIASVLALAGVLFMRMRKRI